MIKLVWLIFLWNTLTPTDQACTEHVLNLSTFPSSTEAQILPNRAQIISINHTLQCCGLITTWKAHILSNVQAETYDVEFQVWRLLRGGCYTKVGGNTFKLQSSGGLIDQPVTRAEQITVQEGDVLGYQANCSRKDSHSGIQLVTGANYSSYLVWYSTPGTAAADYPACIDAEGNGYFNYTNAMPALQLEISVMLCSSQSSIITVGRTLTSIALIVIFAALCTTVILACTMHNGLLQGKCSRSKKSSAAFAVEFHVRNNEPDVTIHTLKEERAIRLMNAKKLNCLMNSSNYYESVNITNPSNQSRDKAQTEIAAKKMSRGTSSEQGPTAESPTGANTSHTHELHVSTSNEVVPDNPVTADTERMQEDDIMYQYNSNISYTATNPITRSDTVNNEYHLSSNICYSSDATEYDETNTSRGNPEYQEIVDTEQVSMSSNVCYNRNNGSTKNRQESPDTLYYEPEGRYADGGSNKAVVNKTCLMKPNGACPTAAEALTVGHIQQQHVPKSKKFHEESLTKSIVYETVQFGPVLHDRKPSKKKSLTASVQYEPYFGEPPGGSIIYESITFGQSSTQNSMEKDFMEKSTPYERMNL